MPMTAEQRINSIVRTFRLGALCESEFCAILLNASKDVTPERLMELLPSELREDVTFWMLDPACSEHYLGCPEYEGLRVCLQGRKRA